MKALFDTLEVNRSKMKKIEKYAVYVDEEDNEEDISPRLNKSIGRQWTIKVLDNKLTNKELQDLIKSAKSKCAIKE